MSNVYRYAFPAVPHFQVPHALDRWLNSISIEELRLLLLVQSEAQKKSLSEVRLSTSEICLKTSIHKTNVARVRRALEDYGLLLTRKEGREHTYVVCDPQKRTAIPDRTSLMDIDLNDVSADVLTRYAKTILKNIKPSKQGLTASCPLPNHPDSTPSFAMDVANGGRWLCRGCAQSGSLMDLEVLISENAVGVTISRTEAHRLMMGKLRSLGLGKSATGKLARPADIVFSYVDEFGEVISEVVRKGGRKSDTRQRRPDPMRAGRYIYDLDGCRNVLFNLPQIIEADTVIVVEGEPDATRLSRLGLLDDALYPVAITTCRNGVDGWLPQHSETLRGKRVILCGDTNEAGVRHMASVKVSLESLGIEVAQIRIPSGYRDVSHFLETHRPQEIIDLMPKDWLEDLEDEDQRPASI